MTESHHVSIFNEAENVFPIMNMYVIYCGVVIATGLCINRFQLSIKDMRSEFNGRHCSVGSVSQRSTGGRGTPWPYLAGQEGHVRHQNHVTATVKCWKGIQPLPLLWGQAGAK